MTTQEITEKYDLPKERAWKVKKQGFFVKNYSKKQIVIDPLNFDPAISYSTAKRVFWKNFSWNKVAVSIKDDLTQEGVTGCTSFREKLRKDPMRNMESVTPTFRCSQCHALISQDLEKAKQVSPIRGDGRKGESAAPGDGKVI